MIGAIAGQGGLPDISTKTQSLYLGLTSSTVYVDVVNITGSGYLLGIFQSGATGTTNRTAQMNLVIDGVTVFNTQLTRSLYGNGIGANFFKKFNTSLLIQHKIEADYVQTAVTVALD